MVTGKEAEAYLKKKEGSAGEGMAERWNKLDALYSARLWHELTLELLQFVKHPELQQDRLLIELYENFIQEFQHRIKPFQLVELCAVIIQQCKTPEEALQFMENCENRVLNDKFRMEPLALIYSKVLRGGILLKSGANVKDLIEEIDESINKLDGITKVHGFFYGLQSQYYLKTENLTGYYRSALKFLGCIDLKTLTHEEQQEHAVMLATSALVADDMYNFGELIAHPVLNSLKRTKNEWVVGLLEAMNVGDVKGIDKLKFRWSTVSTLRDHELQLRSKAILLGIVEMALQRPASKRQLTFQELANATQVPLDQVELYVMKAFAKGILAGKIDEVDQKVHVTWVIPRVLNKDQIHAMAKRMDQWQSDIGKASKLITENEKGFEDLVEQIVEF